jgi:methylmalonyl-CoA mutase N-terminal domain/subunit
MLEGVVAGIEANWFQGEIADAAYRFQRKVSADRMVIVGVNGFTGGNEEPELATLQIGNDVEDAQRKRLSEVRIHRSDSAVQASLARLAADAERSECNLMPAVFEAVRAYATVGEMMDTLAGVFGRWEEKAVI